MARLAMGVLGVAGVIVTAKGEKYDVDALPDMAKGFNINIVVREPQVIHPAALAFDDEGRLFVGGGPQFRDPSPDTPPDSIKIVVDRNRDGEAEKVKTFATGFNSIQALAWKGNDLWVANAPDVTVVRDTDGDDKADEYVRVFKGLGHLRHGLHGFNWGPDGRLYMSQGNSQAQENAPMAFRELMHIDSDLPDNQPINKVYSPEEYEHTYIGEWPSAEGGTLRCGPKGKNLEIFSRGNRNPWDMAFDSGFNWLATDNDPGPNHDRIFMPFLGAHFGFHHPWSFSWTGKDNPPTVPISGLFPPASGSGVGVVYYRSDQFPKSYRDVFLIGDWTNNRVYVYRPRWDGALIQQKGKMELLADGGATRAGDLGFEGGEGRSIFRPTDLAVAPSGAVYVAGWGPQYGSIHAPYGSGDAEAERNYGRVFRIWHGKKPLQGGSERDSAKRDQARGEWSFEELLVDLDSSVHAWRVNAQDELVRRGSKVADDLIAALQGESLSKHQETWAVWALGRIGGESDSFKAWAEGKKGAGLNLRIQALRILGDQLKKGGRVVAEQLEAKQPRIRFAASQALREMGATGRTDAIINAAAQETDRICYYSQWQALRHLLATPELKELLAEGKPRARRAALVALLQDDKLSTETVASLSFEAEEEVASLARLWLEKVGAAQPQKVRVEPSQTNFREPITVTLGTPVDEVEELGIRYTLDGSQPTDASRRYKKPLKIKQDKTLKAALFRQGERIGPVRTVRYHRITDSEWRTQLFVRNLEAGSDLAYRIVSQGLRKGAELFTDRDYTYQAVPQKVRGASYVQTANDDSGVTGSDFLSFEVNVPVKVYLLYDSRSDNLPSWARDAGFTKTGDTVETTDVDFDVFSAEFPAGRVTLGGNGEGAPSMYQVALIKATGSSKQTTIAAAMSAVDQGNPQRGRKLFFKQNNCSACHQIKGQGNAVGPELSDIGARVQAHYIVESILKPNAYITEGYQAATVQLKGGAQVFGLIREETSKVMTVYRIDGSAVTLQKENVVGTTELDRSLMPPSYSLMLSPQDVADVTAYLLKQKSTAAAGK